MRSRRKSQLPGVLFSRHILADFFFSCIRLNTVTSASVCLSDDSLTFAVYEVRHDLLLCVERPPSVSLCERANAGKSTRHFFVNAQLQLATFIQEVIGLSPPPRLLLHFEAAGERLYCYSNKS